MRFIKLFDHFSFLYVLFCVYALGNDSEGEEVLLELRDALKSLGEQDQKAYVKLVGLSSKWFTLMHSTRPFTIRNFDEIADHVKL